MPLQASINHPHLSDHANYVFSPIHIVFVIVFGKPSKATPGVALEVEQPGIAQLSSGISNLITELIAIRSLTSVRFYSVWFSRKKFVYIYCMLKKTGSSFLRYTSYLTKTARSARVSRLSFRFLWLWFNTEKKYW